MSRKGFTTFLSSLPLSPVKRTPVHLLLLLAGWLIAGSSLAQTTVEYIHTDALGSVVAVTNEAGQVIERFDYEPYGAIIGKPDYGGVGFTGHVQDAATGLTYMQQRYYDPVCGCFLSVDPVTAIGGNSIGMLMHSITHIASPIRMGDKVGQIRVLPILGLLCSRRVVAVIPVSRKLLGIWQRRKRR
ncbi:MAG TPA: RHS repeat-associated core domain-containing protein [Pseudoxanthomonas sp.]|nr:RHS repeat-associated core domain-containing protein [Pseudoxanthomonas sp.]